MDSWQYVLLSSIVLLACITFAISIIWHTVRIGISPMPTSGKVKFALAQMLPPADAFAKDSFIFDLGSGWGTLLLLLAKRYPHCHIVGIELSPVPYLVSRFRLMFAGVSNVSLMHRNFFDVSLGRASMVVAYLFPICMPELSTKLEKELPKNTPIITHTFSLPNWTPKEEIRATDLYRTRVYLYYREH